MAEIIYLGEKARINYSHPRGLDQRPKIQVAVEQKDDVLSDLDAVLALGTEPLWKRLSGQEDDWDLLAAEKVQTYSVLLAQRGIKPSRKLQQNIRNKLVTGGNIPEEIVNGLAKSWMGELFPKTQQ